MKNAGFRSKLIDEPSLEILGAEKRLKETLNEARYRHTLGVMYTACALAMRHGIDLEKARIAGLLHDCAKYMKGEEIVRFCREHGVAMSAFEETHPALLHAKAGVYLAGKTYGIRDPEILSAISWHTTGKAEMTPLEQIIYIADFIEPNRSGVSVLPEARKLAFEDLDACCLLIMRRSNEYLKLAGIEADPRTQEAAEYYEQLLDRREGVKK